MINNPFRIRTPLTTDDLFVGRRSHVELALDTVCGGRQAQSIVFYGTRKAGKTSLLRAVERRSDAASQELNCLFSRIDAATIETPLQLCLHLETALSRALDLSAPGDASFETLARLADRLRRSGLRRVGVLIDDFDQIVANELFDVRVFEYLRALISDGVIGMILTSRRPLIEVSHNADVQGSPFFNVLHERWLRPLSDPDAKGFLKLSSQFGVSLKDYEQWILDEAGGQPWLLQEAAETVFDSIKTDSHGPNGPSLADTFAAKADSYFARVWRSLSDTEREAIRQIAAKGTVDSNHLAAAIALDHMGLVSRGPQNWDVPSCALRAWVSIGLESRTARLGGPSQKRNIFVSYAHEDRDLLGERELLGFLRGLERRGHRIWCDERIAGGQDWTREIHAALESADIVVCLISQFWLNSEFVWSNEVPIILRKYAEGTHIVPVLAAECSWQDEEWIARLQVLPSPSTPLRAFTDRGRLEAAYMAILTAIKARLAATAGAPPIGR